MSLDQTAPSPRSRSRLPQKLLLRLPCRQVSLFLVLSSNSCAAPGQTDNHRPSFEMQQAEAELEAFRAARTNSIASAIAALSPVFKGDITKAREYVI